MLLVSIMMLVIAGIFVLLGNSAALLWSLFSPDPGNKEVIAQVSGSVTLILFWISEYFAQSSCKPKGVIDLLRYLFKKQEEYDSTNRIVISPANLEGG